MSAFGARRLSRYIVAWRLGPTMCASDVTVTLDQALAASGHDGATVVQRPRLLSDNGASYVAGDLVDWLDGKGMPHVRGARYHPQPQGKSERWHQTLKNRILLDYYYLPRDLEKQERRLRRKLQSCPLSRKYRKRHTGRRLIRHSGNDPRRRQTHQASHNRKPPLATPIAGCVNFTPR